MEINVLILKRLYDGTLTLFRVGVKIRGRSATFIIRPALAFGPYRYSILAGLDLGPFTLITAWPVKGR